MKRIILGCLLLTAGCRDMAVDNRSIICIDGVEYIWIEYDRGAAIAPHYGVDGTIYLCKPEIDPLGEAATPNS